MTRMHLQSLFRHNLTILSASLIIGLDLVGFAIALASLMFSGALSPWLAMGVTATLASSFLVTLALAGMSQFKTLIGGVQDVGTAVLAATLVTAVSGLSGDAKPATAFAIIAAATLSTGVLLALTGWLKLGRFVRFFPLEVLAGFLAATGCLLLMGGLAMVGQVGPDFSGMIAMLKQASLPAILPALALAVIITLAMKKYGSPLMLLALLVGSACLFHLWRVVAGLAPSDLVAMGLIPELKAGGDATLALPALFMAIDWPTVLQAAPTLATVAALSLFAALMNMSALEVATGKDIDVDREMKFAGVANVLAAGAAGPPGFAHLSLTLLLGKMKISSRGVGLTAAVIQIICLFFAAQIVAFVPTFVAAGLIIYYGLDLVNDWLVRTRKSFSTREWAVVLLIVIISVFYGFLLAILAGLLIATVLFAYSYANAPVVRKATTLAQLPSTTERAPKAAEKLKSIASAVRIFQLQGFLFFGTSDQVVNQVRKTVSESGGLRMVIIDFSRVTEMDSASANAFKRIENLSRSAGFSSIFCGLSPALVATLKRADLVPSEERQIMFSNDLDLALEFAENTLLGEVAGDELPKSLAQHFATPGLPEHKLEQLFEAMKRIQFAAGETIIHAGTAADDVYFIESGRALVRRRMENGAAKRLRTMLPGAIVGDIAYSLRGKRTAEVVAETDTVTLSMSRSTADRLVRKSPELALVFNRLLNRALAEKVITANRMTEHAG